MKIRLAMSVAALLALFASACGSDTADTADLVSSEPATADESADTSRTSAADDAQGEDHLSEPEENGDGATNDSAEASKATDDSAQDATDDSAQDATDDSAQDATDDSAQDATDDSTADTADSSAVPERIVSLNPTATEMLFAIGAGPQVIAVDAFSYYPPEAPVTDLSGWDPNIEAIAGFEPDLVVTDVPFDALADLGIANHVVPAATDIADIYAQIEQLGAVTGHVGEAAELVSRMEIDILTVLASLPERDQALTYYHEVDNTLYSVTSSTFVGYIYELLGLVNIADAADPDGEAFGYPQLSAEFLLDADPDLIFLADTVCCEQSAETVAARPGWDQLTAVQNGNVIELNDDIVSRWGPRIVEFLQVAGAAVSDVTVQPGE